jgi:hypothetical protein
MTPYRSETQQLKGQNSWTFTELTLDESGAVYAAERSAMRDIKPKGLLVRYPNPFTSADEPPEVLYETSDAFTGMYRAPDGALHLRSKKKHYYQVGGKWKSKEVAPRAVVTAIHAYGPRLLVTTGWPDNCFEWIADEYHKLDSEPAECMQIAGDATTGLYATNNQGISFFDGTRWSKLADSPMSARVLVQSADDVISTGFTMGGTTAVYRGNAKAGFQPVVAKANCPTEGRLVGVTGALGQIFFTQTHDIGHGLYRLEGDSVVPIMSATGYCDAAAGSRDLLWHSNGVELLCFDGTTWKSVPRVHHDKTKW